MDMFRANSPLRETVTIEKCIVEHANSLEYSNSMDELIEQSEKEKNEALDMKYREERDYGSEDLKTMTDKD